MNQIVVSFYSDIDHLAVLKYVDIDVNNVRWSKLSLEYLGVVKGIGRQSNIIKSFLNFGNGIRSIHCFFVPCLVQ